MWATRSGCSDVRRARIRVSCPLFLTTLIAFSHFCDQGDARKANIYIYIYIYIFFFGAPQRTTQLNPVHTGIRASRTCPGSRSGLVRLHPLVLPEGALALCPLEPKGCPTGRDVGNRCLLGRSALLPRRAINRWLLHSVARGVGKRWW